ncbi:hypothetical protein MNBD_NITROSPINAE01-1880 [hydrothermal vent metagenome]|uniref:histidine kinase n=1 Tax=hydrothermal vent metagenome TaxID=652676 RepID=A0A3B1C1H6_9ZZZZ
MVQVKRLKAKKKSLAENESLVERHNRILSSITHDLKSPISAIISLVDLLEGEFGGKLGNPKTKKILKLISKAGHESLSLVQEILTMAKMEAGEEKFEPEYVGDLAKELTEVANTFRYEAAAKEVKLIIDIKSSLPMVCWDMRRIRLHALNNLVSNALKFTPAGGMVRISVMKEQSLIVIKVEDDGPGIPVEERQRIFERFEQIDLKSARVFNGCGLGLYNARLIVEQHGGRIYAMEATRGKGAAFTMLLPFYADRQREDVVDSVLYLSKFEGEKEAL